MIFGGCPYSCKHLAGWLLAQCQFRGLLARGEMRFRREKKRPVDLRPGHCEGFPGNTSPLKLRRSRGGILCNPPSDSFTPQVARSVPYGWKQHNMEGWKMAVQQCAETHSASLWKKLNRYEYVWLWWVNYQNVPKICDREHREHNRPQHWITNSILFAIVKGHIHW